MSNKETIHKYIETQITPGQKAVLKDYKEIAIKLPPAMLKLSTALAQSDKRSIELYLSAVTMDVRRAAALSSKTGDLLEKLKKLQSREEFVDDLDEVEEVFKALGVVQKDLNTKFTAGKELENIAEKALEKLGGGKDEATEEWAALEAWANEQIKDGRERVKAVAAARHTARKALEDRDEKAFNEAQKNSHDIRSWAATTWKELDQKVSGFVAKAKKNGLNQPLQDQFARDSKKILEEFSELDTHIVFIYVHWKDLQFKPVDFGKAASLLKVPNNLTDTLKKALNLRGSAMLKALDALGKELKPPAKSSEMIATLRKAGVLPDPEQIEEKFLHPL